MPIELRAPIVLDREWGREVIWAQSAAFMGKILERRAGTKGGLQWHFKEEWHYLVHGSLLVRSVDGNADIQEVIVEPGQAWKVPPGAIHQEHALRDCLVLEVSDPLLNDRVRVDDQYGQVGGGSLPSQSPEEAVSNLRNLATQLQGRAEKLLHWAHQIQQTGRLEPGS